MREIRLSGSEGGGGREASPYPYLSGNGTLPGLRAHSRAPLQFHPALVKSPFHFTLHSSQCGAARRFEGLALMSAALLFAVPQELVTFTQYAVFTSGLTVTFESFVPIGVDVSSTAP